MSTRHPRSLSCPSATLVFPNRADQPQRPQRRRFRSCSAGAVAILSAVVALVPNASARIQPGEAETAFTPSSFMRVVDVDDSTIRMDMGIRLYLPDLAKAPGAAEGAVAAGPVIALAGAIHIAEPEFYDLLQAFLDAQDIVLYEGVKPRGMGMSVADPATAALAAQAVGVPGDPREQTADRIRFTAILLEQHRAATGAYPASLNALETWVSEAALDRVGAWTDTATTDAWGNPLVYTRGEGDSASFDLQSLGADGAPGGEGADADLRFADQEPLTQAELGEEEGIQPRMARALGLVFQLNAMRHDRPNYINSDMALDEVEREIIAEGGDPEALLGVIEGRSIMARLANFSLSIIERSPQVQAMAKVGLMEALRMVEGGGDISQMPGLPPDMQAIMRVIVRDRNETVMRDLNAVLAGEPVEGRAPVVTRDDLTSVAVVYGAGHMADLERRIVDDLGYRPAGVIWLPAMMVDLDEAGLNRNSVRMLRNMLGASMPARGN